MKVAIGGFDGVHIAHQKIIEKADKVVIIEKGSSLTPGFDRLEYIKKPFDFLILKDIKNLSPVDFIQYLKKLNTSHIVVGKDFKFGKDRSGDITLLEKYFKVEAIDEIKLDSIAVHAKTIRKYIREGKIELANKLLGKKYKIKGLQIKGQGLGSKELVATINIELFKPYTIPKEGVYVTLTNNHPSVTFIGKRSTDDNFAIETHILKENFNTPRLITIEFLKFLRDNKKFNSLKELKKQIENDIKKANSFFR
jgi:riboflavin kinase/FMN adenylyltransferase